MQCRIKADIIVISCDTITNASLFPLITEFRQHNASLAALFLKGGAEVDTVVPGPKNKPKPERDLAGIDARTKRLHFLASTSDYEDIVIIAGHLLRVNPHLVIHSRLIDSHVYIVRRWVIDYLVPSKGFSTIKGELVPFVIKSQLKRTGLAADMDRPYSVVNEDTSDEDVFNVSAGVICAVPLCLVKLKSSASIAVRGGIGAGGENHCKLAVQRHEFAQSVQQGRDPVLCHAGAGQCVRHSREHDARLLCGQREGKRIIIIIIRNGSV